MELNTGINPIPTPPKVLRAKTPIAVPKVAADPFVAERDAAKKERDTALAEQTALLKAQGEKEDTLFAQESARMDKTDADLAAARAAAPKPPAEVFQHVQKNMSDLSGMLLVLSALGGALTKQPFTAALNNMSAAINGFVKGDQESFANEYQQFQENFKRGQEAHKEYMDDLKWIDEQHKNDHQRWLEAYQHMQLEHGNLKDLGQYKIKAADETMRDIAGREQAHKTAMTLAEQHFKELQTVMLGMAKLGETKHYHDETIADRVESHAKPKGASQNASVRANQVRAGVQNSLRIMDQMEKDYGTGPTSSIFFGTHDDTATGRLTAGVAQSAMTEKQRKIDANMQGLAEEATLALTGGLRASDSFRKWVRDQLPYTPRDNKATAQERFRVLRDNLNGTSSAWAQKLAADPANFASKQDHDVYVKEVLPAHEQGGATASNIDPEVEAILKKHGVK